MKNKNKSMYSIRNKKKAKHPFIIVGANKKRSSQLWYSL